MLNEPLVGGALKACILLWGMGHVPKKMFEKYVLRNAFYYVLEAVSDFQTAYGNASICV